MARFLGRLGGAGQLQNRRRHGEKYGLRDAVGLLPGYAATGRRAECVAGLFCQAGRA